jgi:quercetin dioxygenase-like cupin family protein
MPNPKNGTTTNAQNMSRHEVWMPGRVRTEVHLVSADTAGAFCLLIDHPPPGWRLPAHRHVDAAETIHIVDGKFEMNLDGQPTRLIAGETIHVPAGAVHDGRNVGDSTGQRVLIFSPAGMEEFFLEVGRPSPEDEIDARAALESAIRHGWEFSPG